MARKKTNSLSTGSKLEQALAWQLRCAMPDYVWLTELRFHVKRRWRFDFACPLRRIAIEVEGIGSAAQGGKSRHLTLQGYRDDCEKYNAAALLGWRVFRFTDREIKNGSALKVIEEAVSTSYGVW